MKKTIAIGIQDFEKIRNNQIFYIDKTNFIKEWWDKKDDVTLITRPRRFGKTLNMNMLECFFSNKYEGRSDLFEGLDIWKHEEYRKLQGTYPVIFLSFAGVKYTNYENTRKSINEIIANCYDQYSWLIDSDTLSENDKKYRKKINTEMDDSTAATSLNNLCKHLYNHYGKKCIIILDEYDTPLQEAYVNNFWNELVAYTRALFNNTFKTNPYMERGIMTGITRVSKESVFSDLNNLNVVTTTSDEYATAFGFTEKEVFEATDAQGMTEIDKQKIKQWYDGFVFGNVKDIYNPWSIINYLDKGKIDKYWANTSGNGLISKLLQKGDNALKINFESLLQGESIIASIDEQIVFNQLDNNIDAVWSLLLASGYLKVADYTEYAALDDESQLTYTLKLTNLETTIMFREMINGWFKNTSSFNSFVKAMFNGDVDDMNGYMNRIALSTFSYFDTGNTPSDDAPERFYHGFVLGLLVDNVNDYTITSNRESGFGRYDIMLEPKNEANPAVIIEFKVINKNTGEKDLSDTADNAIKQINDKKYKESLIAKGINEANILIYGFAFEGKKVLIKKG